MNTEGLELKFTKLDRRHRGFEDFKYYVTVNDKPIHSYRPGKTNYIGFFVLRCLCSETWGLSCERELYLKLKNENNPAELNDHWVWHTDMNNSQYRIYLKGDEERAWILLKW